MKNTNWILLDTETTGLNAPVFVVELAAQRMLGWEPLGEPFRKLLNQDEEIPPEASRARRHESASRRRSTGKEERMCTVDGQTVVRSDGLTSPPASEPYRRRAYGEHPGIYLTA